MAMGSWARPGSTAAADHYKQKTGRNFSTRAGSQSKIQASNAMFLLRRVVLPGIADDTRVWERAEIASLGY